MNDTIKARMRKPVIKITPAIEDGLFIVAEGFSREVRQAISGHMTMAGANAARDMYFGERGPSVAPLTIIAADRIEWVE